MKKDPDGQLSIGEKAPQFALPDTVSGKTISLSDFEGKVKALCIIFSCNHCPHVIKNEERMIVLGREFPARGVPFIVISANDLVKYPQDGPLEMQKRAAQKGYPFPYLFDESQEVTHSYGAQVTPHVFLFDGDLILRYRGAIDDNPDQQLQETQNYLRDAIEAILIGKGASISPATTRALGCSIKWK